MGKVRGMYRIKGEEDNGKGDRETNSLCTFSLSIQPLGWGSLLGDMLRMR